MEQVFGGSLYYRFFNEYVWKLSKEKNLNSIFLKTQGFGRNQYNTGFVILVNTGKAIIFQLKIIF